MRGLRLHCAMLVLLVTGSIAGCATRSPRIIPMECPTPPRPPADLMQPPAMQSYWPFYERLKRID